MQSKFVTYKPLNQIDVYHFTSNSSQAVDEYFEMAAPKLAAFIEHGDLALPYCFALDISDSGMFSINYSMAKMKAFFGKYKVLPELYIAYIVSNKADTMVINWLNWITTRKLSNTRRIFTNEERDQAFAWLTQILEAAHQDNVARR